MGYSIKANQPVNGKHWELEFVNGIAETDNPAIAGRYRKRGYLVTDTQPEPEITPEPKKTGKRKKEV